MSDHNGARIVLNKLLSATTGTGDRGYDSNRFRTSLAASGIVPCILPTKNQKVPIGYDRTLYKQRSPDQDHARQAQGLTPPCDAL